MKKLILILLFSFLSIPLFAQSIWWIDTTSTGAERKVYLGDYDSVRTSGGLNFGRLPIKATVSAIATVEGIDSLITEIANLNISVDSLKADLATTKDTLNVLKNKDFATETSLLNAIDSLIALRDSLAAKITVANNYLTLINSKVSVANKGLDSNSATVSTEVDTIDISTATTWAEFAVFAINDTLEYSKDGVSWRRVFPYMFASTGRISPITYPEIYIRRKGTAGTVTYDYSWIGY